MVDNLIEEYKTLREEIGRYHTYILNVLLGNLAAVGALAGLGLKEKNPIFLLIALVFVVATLFMIVVRRLSASRAAACLRIVHEPKLGLHWETAIKGPEWTAAQKAVWETEGTPEDQWMSKPKEGTAVLITYMMLAVLLVLATFYCQMDDKGVLHVRPLVVAFLVLIGTVFTVVFRIAIWAYEEASGYFEKCWKEYRVSNDWGKIQ
ncbi:hypothetical protein KKH27_02575 [bacterium]|nr:hypothetical protein [bacterium]MBU1982887.1 hypothetical protein [bacterium]